jgi:hypothetical protein|tara:strand:- start:8763 stop:9239 length:477 start_codon:yes stop_codon:yes gene_type:complete
MIAETLAGIALFKASVEGIKSVIGTANDVSSFAKHIDGMFTAQTQVNKDRYKRGGIKNLKDQFNIGSVAEEMIDAKLVEEQMREIATMIDFRFGFGTWTSILTERAKRIQEMRAEQKQIALEKKQKQDEIIEVVMVIGAVILVGVVLIGGVTIWLKLS